MNPLAFYQLADWLIANRRSPDGYRSSVSRAYYGAFHSALQFLEEMGLHIPSTDNKHEKLIGVASARRRLCPRNSGSSGTGPQDSFQKPWMALFPRFIGRQQIFVVGPVTVRK